MSNRFVFVVPAFNAEKTVERMLASVAFQTHEDWLILMRDDMSTDNTVDVIKDFCDRNGIASRVRSKAGDTLRGHGKIPYLVEGCKVIVDVNSEKFWEVKNVLSMINDPLVKEDDIICRLDADDSLIDLCALQDLNMVYEKTQADFIYTAHRWTGTEQVVDHGNNIYSVQFYNDSKPYTHGSDPYKHVWSTSHFKTFRKSLLNNVCDENYRDKDGEYIKRAGDRAIVYPALHNAKKVVYFPKATYLYRIDPSPQTFASSDSKYQKEEADFLIDRGYVDDC